MEFLPFGNYHQMGYDQNFRNCVPQNTNKKRKTCNSFGQVTNDDLLTPVRQRSQANARERDRTQR